VKLNFFNSHNFSSQKKNNNQKIGDIIVKIHKYTHLINKAIEIAISKIKNIKKNTKSKNHF